MLPAGGDAKRYTGPGDIPIKSDVCGELLAVS